MQWSFSTKWCCLVHLCGRFFLAYFFWGMHFMRKPPRISDITPPYHPQCHAMYHFPSTPPLFPSICLTLLVSHAIVPALTHDAVSRTIRNLDDGCAHAPGHQAFPHLAQAGRSIKVTTVATVLVFGAAPQHLCGGGGARPHHLVHVHGIDLLRPHVCFAADDKVLLGGGHAG